jgi:hypothetical protein
MESMHSSHNLLRHDGTIVINEMRSVFSSWTDRLLAIAILPIALVAIHRSLAHRPLVVAASVVSALAVIVGGGVARLIHRYPWINYIGLVVILWVAGNMIYEGWMGGENVLGLRTALGFDHAGNR